MGKDQAARIWTLQALVKRCAGGRGAISAGELSKYMGVSRNTAFKRLEELHDLGLCERVARHKRNVVYHAYYAESGRDYSKPIRKGSKK